MKDDILRIIDLNKSFSNQQILHNINFNLKRGHIIGLIGANGAGKTTIMKTILGITDFKGEIIINNTHVTKQFHKPLKSVGALIEYPGLYPFLSGREQLNLFASGNNRRKKANEIITKLKMNNYADLKTKDYSLGMKQKLGIGLALLNNPKLVILDEPMNGLDPKATKELRDLIVSEKKLGTTFLISSHILSDLQKIADDIIIINHGTIVKNTTMQKILSLNTPLYIFQTNNDELATKLLVENHFPIQNGTNICLPVTNEFPINDVLQLLLSHNIKIIDIKQQIGDLEESLLNILNTDKSIIGDVK